MALFRRVKPPFSLKTLQKDSNCIAIQDPSAVWGVQDFLPRRNLLTYSEDFSNAAWAKYSVDATTDTLTANNTSPAPRVTQSISSIRATSITYSVELKAGTVTTARLYVYNNTTASVLLASDVTISNGVAVGDGWYKHTALISSGISSGNQVIVYIYPRGATGNQVGDSIQVRKAQVISADTIDQSYQRVTDWTTEQYAWAAAKQVPWLRRNRFVSTETLSTQTVSSVTATPLTVSFKGTGTITFSTAYSGSLVGTGANDRVTATFTPAAGNLVCTVSGTVTEAQCEVAGAATEYQPILASWDATYTANAIAAGYPISLWHDAAGTIAAWESGRAIGAVRDQKYDGYGSELVSSQAASTWVAYGANTIADTADGVLVTYVDSANGMYRYLRATTGLSSDLKVGSTYICTFLLKTDNSSAISMLLWNGVGNLSLGNFTSYGYHTLVTCVFVASSTTGCYVRGSSLAAGGKYWVKNLSVREIPGYTAIQSTGANQPLWVLDANGKPLIRRDGVNDTLPITLPNLGTDCEVFVGTGSTVSEAVDQTLNGSYAPLTPSDDYGRVIFATTPRYRSKLIKWLLAKAGY